MKKRVFGKKLSRSKSARRALFRGLVRALVFHGSIKTTKAKAKAVRGEVDSIVGLARRGGLSERRRVYAKLGSDRETTDLLFSKVAPTFSGRKSGFTRIVPLPLRRGDRAEMVRLEWVEEIAGSEVGKKGKTKKKKETSKTKKANRTSVTTKLTGIARKEKTAKTQKSRKDKKK